MIWQLWKRRAALPTAIMTVFLALAAFGLAFVPLPPRVPTHDAMGKVHVNALSLSLVMGVWLMMTLQSTWTLLDAALPISGRDLWIARLLGALGIVWLPSAAEAAFGLPPVRVFEAAAIITVFVLIATCLRIRQSGWPKWFTKSLLQIFFLIPLATIWFGKYLRTVHWPAEPPPQTVFAICGLISLALFVWDLANAPRAFQFASTGARFAPVEAGDATERSDAPQRREAREEPAGSAWAPLLQSLYPVREMLDPLHLCRWVHASGTAGDRRDRCDTPGQDPGQVPMAVGSSNFSTQAFRIADDRAGSRSRCSLPRQLLPCWKAPADAPRRTGPLRSRANRRVPDDFLSRACLLSLAQPPSGLDALGSLRLGLSRYAACDWVSLRQHCRAPLRSPSAKRMAVRGRAGDSAARLLLACARSLRRARVPCAVSRNPKLQSQECHMTRPFTFLLFAALACGQGPPAFEVASVRPAPQPPPGTPNPPVSLIDNAHVKFHLPLQGIVCAAYGVRADQVAGPAWIVNTRFDVEAKLPDGATAEQVPAMLQALLADRFKMTMHHESRDQTVSALVVSKDGFKLQPSRPPRRTRSLRHVAEKRDGCFPHAGTSVTGTSAAFSIAIANGDTKITSGPKGQRVEVSSIRSPGRVSGLHADDPRPALRQSFHRDR